jgi:hypothetical protein
MDIMNELVEKINDIMFIKVAAPGCEIFSVNINGAPLFPQMQK